MSWFPVILILPYIILLLDRYRSLTRLKTFNVSSDPVTFVSVVVACHNEQNNLHSLLRCLALQSYPSNLFEIIIVNDNSTDRTFEIAKGFKDLNNIQIINNRGTGKKLALRTGIEASRGRIVIVTDADCTMKEDWIRTIASFYESSNPDMIICPVQMESAQDMFGLFQELEFMGLQGVTAGFSKPENAVMCNGANMAFTKKTYQENSANLHDEINSGDDIFLLHSLKKNRGKILWLESSDVAVTTRSATTFRIFLKQRSRWISKSTAYSDSYSIIFGIATFIALMLQAIFFISMIFSLSLAWVFLLVFVLKSIPDYLILHNTSHRYQKSGLMKWFLPVQLIYPFYVLSVVIYSWIFRQK